VSKGGHGLAVEFGITRNLLFPKVNHDVPIWHAACLSEGRDKPRRSAQIKTLIQAENKTKKYSHNY
jgi:hypothetical protein